MRIRAFQGLRPKESVVSQVAGPPYDVINHEEALALANGNPLSILHVTRAEIDLPPGTDPHSDAVYAQAVKYFKKLQQEGHLLRENAPCLYLYQQQMGPHKQRGLVATCLVEDYDKNLIKKHEKTRQDKEDDRTRLTGDICANPGPVFLTYRDLKTIDALVEKVAATAPLNDFTDENSIRHITWRIPGGEAFIQAFAAVPCVYIADGHHRAASAARVGRERRAANPRHTGHEAYNGFLAVLFPASQLQILPYNRFVQDLNGLKPDEFLKKVKAVAALSENASPKPSQPGEIRMYIGGKWFGLSFAPDPKADPVSRLDVSMLQDRLLKPLLGIDDPRTSQRIEFVGGIRGTDALVKKVDGGAAAVAFSLFPVTIGQLMDIADAGQIMPPKSTWFEPKLRSGLFIHTFEPRP